MAGSLLIAGAAVTGSYVGWRSLAESPRHQASSTPTARAAAATSRDSSMAASRLRAGMVIEYHGRRWLVVRVSEVTTHPGVLLELREAGMPGFHIVYLEPSSSVNVVGPA